MRFNPREYWQSLIPTEQQEFIDGALLVLFSHSVRPALSDDMPAYRPWSHAHDEGWRLIDGVVPAALAPDMYRDGVDLAPLGIRACRVCGCTDNSACAGGCGWVERDLCSLCIPPK